MTRRVGGRERDAALRTRLSVSAAPCLPPRIFMPAGYRALPAVLKHYPRCTYPAYRPRYRPLLDVWDEGQRRAVRKRMAASPELLLCSLLRAHACLPLRTRHACNNGGGPARHLRFAQHGTGAWRFTLPLALYRLPRGLHSATHRTAPLRLPCGAGVATSAASTCLTCGAREHLDGDTLVGERTATAAHARTAGIGFRQFSRSCQARPPLCGTVHRLLGFAFACGSGLRL